LPGSDIVRWRLRLLDDAGLPVEGASFYFDPLGSDLAGHATWTDEVVTDEAGEVFLGDPAGFPSAWAQVRDGITHHLSLALPEGGYLLALELVRLNDGAVLGSGDRAFTVGPAEPAG
jgi:hypothetical protein